MLNNYVVLFLFLYCSIFVNGYRILVVFPAASYSHQVPQQAVSRGLAARGHHVTIISPNTFETNDTNILQIDCGFLYEYWSLMNFSKGMNMDEFLQVIVKYTSLLVDALLSHEPVKQLLDDIRNGIIKFDAVIVENLGYTPIYAIAEEFNLPLIGLTTMELIPSAHRAMGNPAHPILHPSSLLASAKQPNFIEKCKLIYATLGMEYWMYFYYLPSLQTLIQKHFNIKKNSIELMSRFDFAIEGRTAELGNARPLLPNTVQISFLHIKPVQELPTDLKEYLDKSPGVIYVSFGTNVKSSLMSADIRNALIETFQYLKYDILWKFENDVLDGKPDNVKIQKWLPQQDVLAHKNVKLFIMQGGQQSMEEAIFHGIPMVVIPFFADQKENSLQMRRLGIASLIEPSEITQNKLMDVINDVLSNTKYKTTIKTLGKRIKDKPMAPVDTATWWIEYAIRNYKADHLKYKGMSVSFIEYYLLDIILVHVVLILIILYLLIKFNSFCISQTKNIKKGSLKKKHQ